MMPWPEVAELVRQKHGLPDDWFISSINCRKDVCPEGWVRIEGGRYPVVTRGPRKGEPNWRKPLDKGQVFFVTLEEIGMEG